MAEAKAKFSEVVEQAQEKGPQQITKNGRPVAVLISMEEWKQRVSAQTSQKKTLQSSSGTRPARFRDQDWQRAAGPGGSIFEISAGYRCDFAAYKRPA